ncbi:Cytolysin/lectin [Gautieria morchelliformis]|nr:Cytolysin/lectin [Gautieria morchelliformis]
MTYTHYANGGTWSESNGMLVLTMGGSGTSGTLRFVADTGEIFLIVLGLHNYAPWCNVVPDLAAMEPAEAVNAEYYAGGKRSGPSTTRLYCKQCEREENLSQFYGDGFGVI